MILQSTNQKSSTEVIHTGTVEWNVCDSMELGQWNGIYVIVWNWDSGMEWDV